MKTGCRQRETQRYYAPEADGDRLDHATVLPGSETGVAIGWLDDDGTWLPEWLRVRWRPAGSAPG